MRVVLVQISFLVGGDRGWLTLSIPLHSCQGGPPASNLSSRPERTRISCHAALTSSRVCGFQ